MRHAPAPAKCTYCKRLDYFVIQIVEQEDKSYMLSRCPNCNRHEEVKEVISKRKIEGEENAKELF